MNEEIAFHMLKNGRMACIRGKRVGYSKRREIIFPDKFNPKEGERYRVGIRHTKHGEYVYDSETFDVSYAILATVASPIDEANVLYAPRTGISSLAAAFDQAGI